MNILTFDPMELTALISKSHGSDGFTGVFISSESYSQLLDIVDIYFGLGMKTDTCQYPLLEHCYMLIRNNTPSSTSNIPSALGKKVKMQVSHLIHNEKYGVVAAHVVLKNNFTCNHIPHIVITKRDSLSNSTVKRIINGELDYKHPSISKKLHAPYTLHGAIGVMFNSDLEKEPLSSTKIITDETGYDEHHTGRVVVRPELTITVDNYPPPKEDQKYVTFEELKNDGKNETEPSKEYYQGCLVQKGARGGKYIVKDGKKKYLTKAEKVESESTSGLSGKPIYNVNLLDK